MYFQNILNHLVSIILLTSLLTVADSAIWSCFQDGKAVPLSPGQVAGVWYEIARFPSSNVPVCVEVIAPDSQEGGNYTLELDYINNVNNGWQRTQESLVFPWNEAKNGSFNLQYSDRDINVAVEFKYLGSMRGYSVVCGYTDFATSISIIRILSRNKLINSTVKTEIKALANQYNINMPDLTWVQQDGRCSGSTNLSMFNFGLLISFHLFQTVLKNTLSA